MRPLSLSCDGASIVDLRRANHDLHQAGKCSVGSDNDELIYVIKFTKNELNCAHRQATKLTSLLEETLHDERTAIGENTTTHLNAMIELRAFK